MAQTSAEYEGVVFARSGSKREGGLYQVMPYSIVRYNELL
jgi:hypothetical protein